MTTAETITEKIHKLPVSSQKKVFDFVDELPEKSGKTNAGEKASAWEDWANSHQGNIATVDDSREAI